MNWYIGSMGYKLFSIFFMAFGLWAMIDGTQRAMEGIRARSWPVADGRILLSRYDQWRTQKGIRIAGLCIDVQYIYQVGDKVYDGHRINSGWRCFGNQKHLEGFLRKYPSGKKVLVHYNPDDPAQALLEPGLDWTPFFLWGLGLISMSAAWPLLKKGIMPSHRSKT